MMVWEVWKMIFLFQGARKNSQVPGVNLPGCNLSPFYLLSPFSTTQIQGARRHSTGMVAQRRHPHWTVSFEKKNAPRRQIGWKQKKCLKSWSFAMSGCVFFAKKNKSCIPFCASFVESSFCWPVRILVFWSVNRKPPFAQQDLTSLFWGNSSDSEWFFFPSQCSSFWSLGRNHPDAPTRVTIRHQPKHCTMIRENPQSYGTVHLHQVWSQNSWHFMTPPTNFSPDSESLPWSLHWPPWHASDRNFGRLPSFLLPLGPDNLQKLGCITAWSHSS